MELFNYNPETRNFSTEDTRTFGLKSKLLGAAAPGAWYNKEAEKFLHDDEASYKKARGKAALKGWFAPMAAMNRFNHASKLHAEGKNPKQIKAALDKTRDVRYITGVAENLTVTGGRVAGRVATVGGLYRGITKKGRKKFKK